VVQASGFGAGTRDPAQRPNCLRLIAAEISAQTAAGTQRESGLLLLQADIDDMPAEYVSAALDAVRDAGALDAVALHLAMKKGRLGHRIEMIVGAAGLDAVTAALFRASTTIGIRFWPVARRTLARTEALREWRGQQIRCKQVVLPDGTSRAKPEYEDVIRAAAALGLTAYEVRQALETELPQNS
jgi:uncharacterized protein (DUF111 family)